MHMSQDIDFKNVKKLLNPILFSNLEIEEKSYKISIDSPINLLSTNRLDIVAKYLFILNKNKYYKKMYLESIKCINNFYEADKSGKIGEAKFIEAFEKLDLSIKEHFNPNISIIPVDRNNNLIDGAHRVASAMVENQNIYFVKLDVDAKHELNYEFFQERNFPETYLEQMVLEYIKLKKNVRVAILFPNNTDNGDYAVNLMKKNSNVLYHKRISVNEIGKNNLIYYSYKNESWIGNENNNFNGIKAKKQQCFKYGDDIQVLFLEEKLDKMNNVKSQIRNFYNLGNHSIHASDTYEETIVLSELLLNKNSIHFLNNHNRLYTNLLETKLNEFSSYLKLNKIDKENIVIDSSFVMGLYGLRVPNDLDYIVTEKHSHILKDNHNIYYPYDDIEDLIYNPINFFYFHGFKILSIGNMMEMKMLRGEKKDIEDIDLASKVDQSQNRINELNNKIFNYIKSKEIIVFGSQAIYSRLKLFDIKLSFIIDNNVLENKEMYMNEYIVCNPNRITKMKKSDVMIVIPNHHFLSMSEQLRAMGLIQNEHFFNSDLVINVLSTYPRENQKILYKGHVINYPKGCSLIEQIGVDGYEPLLVNALQKELSELNNNELVMLDIGANIGLISFDLVNRFEKLKIYAFEPTNSTFKLLNKSVQENSLNGKINVFNTAIGDFDGNAQFFIHNCSDSSGDGLIDTGRAGESKAVITEICKLDTWSMKNKVSNISIIKIDVEGAELLVLRGAIELIKRYKPIIFMELLEINVKNYDFEINDIFNFIDKINYSCFSLDGDQVDISNYYKFDTLLLKPS